MIQTTGFDAILWNRCGMKKNKYLKERKKPKERARDGNLLKDKKSKLLLRCLNSHGGEMSPGRKVIRPQYRSPKCSAGVQLHRCSSESWTFLPEFAEITGAEVFKKPPPPHFNFLLSSKANGLAYFSRLRFIHHNSRKCFSDKFSHSTGRYFFFTCSKEWWEKSDSTVDQEINEEEEEEGGGPRVGRLLSRIRGLLWNVDQTSLRACLSESNHHYVNTACHQDGWVWARSRWPVRSVLLWWMDGNTHTLEKKK